MKTYIVTDTKTGESSEYTENEMRDMWIEAGELEFFQELRTLCQKHGIILGGPKLELWALEDGLDELSFDKWQDMRTADNQT